MDREWFLDAQLWLRRVSAADWAALGGDGEQLLPLATAEPAAAWCCFHVGARLCVFDAGGTGDDATQLRLELRRRRLPPLLLARFDGRCAFAVDLRAVAAVTAPLELSAASREQQETPPFGSLELPHVSLRVWVEPRDATPAAARQMLQHALLSVQQSVVQTRQSLLLEDAGERATALDGSWRDVFRHSRRGSEAPARLQLATPATLLQHARRVFKRDADFEAVRATCWQIVRSSRASPRRRRETRESDAGDAQPPPSGLEEPFLEKEFALLLTELAHIFGDNHDGVSELLGFGGAGGGLCHAHERCFALHEPERDERGPAAGCVTAKWEAWDEYLEAAAQVPTSSMDPPGAEQTALLAAVTSFQRAVTNASDAAAWQQRAVAHCEQIRAFERVAFDAFFPSSDRQPLAGAAVPQLLQQLKVEQLLGVLLEKRKQLLRDDLAFSLLPQRRRPLGEGEGEGEGSSTNM